LVDTGRPARNIAGNAFAAIEDVEFLDRLRLTWSNRQNHRRQRGSQTHQPVHAFLPDRPTAADGADVTSPTLRRTGAIRSNRCYRAISWRMRTTLMRAKLKM